MEGREEEVWSPQLQLSTEEPQLALTVQRTGSKAAFPLALATVKPLALGRGQPLPYHFTW